MGLFGISLISLSKNWIINSRKDLCRNYLIPLISQWLRHDKILQVIKTVQKNLQVSLKYIFTVSVWQEMRESSSLSSSLRSLWWTDDAVNSRDQSKTRSLFTLIVLPSAARVWSSTLVALGPSMLPHPLWEALDGYNKSTWRWRLTVWEERRLQQGEAVCVVYWMSRVSSGTLRSSTPVHGFNSFFLLCFVLCFLIFFLLMYVLDIPLANLLHGYRCESWWHTTKQWGVLAGWGQCHPGSVFMWMFLVEERAGVWVSRSAMAVVSHEGNDTGRGSREL